MASPRAVPIPSAEDAYAQLRALIVQSTLAPGTRVTEPQLASMLDMSRTPVREAIHRLRFEGLFVADGGGARPRMAVAPLDVEEARALYQTAGLLESAGAQRIATWAPARRRELARALLQEDAAFRKEARTPHPNPVVLFERHHTFHQCIIRASASPVARELLTSLEPRLERYEWSHGPLLQRAGLPFTPTFDEHGVIVDAVRSGTARALERAIRQNWDNAAERLAFALVRTRSAIR